ncbi:unnamed protein product [marine sediment metagenome]|uniref:Uncharacterized protein n=1 Tax=marine sediment metagenome TaxID=412755 RepID=X1BGF4_9ZZZZ
MYLGRYVAGDKVWITACCHKFETGQELESAVTGYYLKVGAAFGTAVALNFNLMNAETGIYFAEIDTTAFDDAPYMAVLEAVVDGVAANLIQFFEVRTVYGRYAP